MDSIFPVGSRVEVETFGCTGRMIEPPIARGVVVEALNDDPDDPVYLIELEGVKDLPAPDRDDETETRRWFAWEFVTKISLLDLIAEAASEGSL